MKLSGHTGHWIVATLLLTAAVARAGEFDPVLYELREGSYLVDDCDCGRPAVMVPVQGTMVLERLPVRIQGELYAISDVRFTPVEPSLETPFTVTGDGQLWRHGENLTEQDIDFELAIGSTEGIVLSGARKVSDDLWPTFEADAGESGKRDPLHIYSLHIAAAPVTEMVRYELVTDGINGSYFVDDCIPCGRPTIPIPIEGTFLLGEIAGGPNPIKTYRIDGIDFRGVANDAKLRLTGSGLYRQGGEVALTQELRLDLVLDGGRSGHLESDSVAVETAWPKLDVGALETEPVSEMSVWSVRLLARPVEPLGGVPFRRGDANADGGMDIADPIFTLQSLFAGGPGHTCQEAADANGDGSIDVSDPMYGLLYLFRSGAVPPAPGPDDCGEAPQPVLGCADYPSCG